MDKQWRVLILEDDFRVAKIHADIVNNAPGFLVSGTIRTIAEARASIGISVPDLILADVYLPDGDGIDLVREIPADAFVLSAADDASTVRRALRAGALAYLVKPFPQSLLTQRLDRYLRFRRSLAGVQGLRQEKIDQALAIMHQTPDAASTSKSVTDQLLLDALEHSELSATTAAEIIGASRATAQRRLASMANKGVIDVRLRYGQSGRPEHLYRRNSS